MWSIAWVSLVIGGLVLGALAVKVVDPTLRAIEAEYKVAFRASCYLAGLALIALLVVLLVAPSLPVPAELLLIIRRLLSITFIGVVTGFSLKLVYTGRAILLSRYNLAAKDNLRARAVHTQVNVLVKVLVIVLVLVAVASVMMVFENVRQLGTSILASAGVVGIIVGFAAQRSIATLLSGLQVAITQPIRIDDVVIIDGEWGQIEEITLTYVVVRIWDLRRLVVPVNHFLEKTFQNWTRTTADLLGAVNLHVDYRLPVEVVRKQLYEILKDHELWDGKVWRVHVVNATERTVELRALMSAANASNAWELRCDVREKLLNFLQQNYPHCLPKIRAEVLTPLPNQ